MDTASQIAGLQLASWLQRGLRVGSLLLAWFLVAMPVFGAGMLIPKDQDIGPLAIKHQRVEIKIKDGVASTHIEQVFHNSANRDLEAVYIFPLPENAAISDFALYINGKRTSGELMEKDKARGIYQDIVRRMKDPGLLEHIGGSLFRVSVYPVPKNGDQRIELDYTQPLAFDAGLYRLTYPLKTGERASQTLDDFTVSVKLESSVPLKNIYSPSHVIGITHKGEHEAVIGFEENRSMMDRDFVLYYGVSKKEFGVNLLTHAPGNDDGYFMLLLAPALAEARRTPISRDVTFVLDTSGSMTGEKLTQAKGALQYCLNRLNPGDRFNVVRFSTDVDTLYDAPRPADKSARKQALDFIERIEARGGTAINDALATALKIKPEPGRPRMIVFLTDGQPTIGETDTVRILENANKAAGSKIRIFTFGVGISVNTHLLDPLAADNGGVSHYVLPDENIEVKVSSFYDKISLPLLIQPKITIDRMKVRDVHPKELPDLFAGGQITVLGRYQGQGDYAIRLTGEIDGKPVEFVYEATFPKRTIENNFIPRIWATRRVGFLLDQIRLKGEERELKDEVLRLGKDYGIMTPYTSYLVVEDTRPTSTAVRPDAPGVPRPVEERKGAGGWNARGDVDGDESAADHLWAEGSISAPAKSGAEQHFVPLYGSRVGASRPASQMAVKRKTVFADERRLENYYKAEEGAKAIELSKAIRDYSNQEKEDDKASVSFRRIGAKVFDKIDDTWIDRDYKESMKTTAIKYGSDEYFKLLERSPEMKKYLALGVKVIVCLNDKEAVRIEEQ